MPDPKPDTSDPAEPTLVCPTCGGPVVYDGGLWHCDEGGHGAWDRESLAVEGTA